MDRDDDRVPPQLRPQPHHFRFPLEAALRSVVALEAEVPPSAFTAEVLGTERAGSGVVIHENGLVLTIGYLVCEAADIRIETADGRVTPGVLLAYDFETGFGLVQATRPLGVPPAELGRAADVRVGERLLVAAAGGRERAVACRLVRRRPFAGYWEYMIEDALFTAPAHPFWGGTGCFDGSGLLVGIGSLLVQSGDERHPERTNMIVPVDLLLPILDDLRVHGRARRRPRPWLGLYLEESESGLLVLGTARGGPAERAGLEAGDRIYEIGGLPVADLADFYEILWGLGEAGVAVPLAVLRDDRRLALTLVSADRDRFLARRPPDRAGGS